MTLDDAFREPWVAVGQERARELEAEALAEIGPDHELAGGRLQAIARCTGCANVVYSLSDGTFAILHLTWSRTKPEQSPSPSTTRYGSFIAIELGMDQHEH